MSLTRRATALLVAATTAGTVVAAGGPVAAHAAQVQPVSCATTSTWSFDPPLSDTTQAGTATATYTGNCATAGVNGLLPIEATYAPVYTVIYTYLGTCSSTDLFYDNGNGSGVLLDGALLATTDETADYSFTQVGVLQGAPPFSPFCSMSSATGVTVENGSYDQIAL